MTRLDTERTLTCGAGSVIGRALPAVPAPGAAARNGVALAMVLPALNPIKLTSHSRARVRKYDYQPSM
jgi:hypothetical protein